MARNKTVNTNAHQFKQVIRIVEGWSAPRGERLPITKWKAGDVVVGKYVSIKKLPDSNGKTGGHIFIMEMLDGKRVCYGAPTLLLEVLEELTPGDTWVHITCKGQTIKTKRGQNAWDFEVRTRDTAPGSI